MSTNNKIFKITIPVLFVFCISQISCKKSDWYDAKPYKSLAVPETFEDMQAILDNSPSLNQYSPSLGEIGSDGHYVNDANYTIMPKMDKNAYTWTHTVPYKAVTEWNRESFFGAYPRVFSCNLVLEKLNDITPKGSIEQINWNSLKGQALFHRARTFYELSQVFASPYNPSTAASDLGIPLRLETDINILAARSTVKDTYDQVIADLLLAKDVLPINELPTTNLSKTRPTKVAVLALLARVYLSMEDYTEAGKYADQCLNLYGTLIDYAQWKPVSPSLTFSIYHPETIWYGIMSDQFQPLFSSRILIDTTLYNLYSDDDLRKSYFYTKSTTTKLVTFKGRYSGSTASLFSGLATDEILLIRAECYARAQNTDAAMKDLNDLLRNRWRKDLSGATLYIDQTAPNSEEALKLILLERQKELILRGLRWSDLRRLNKDDRFKITITRTTPEGLFTLEPNSYKYTFPIPDDVISLNGIQQNPGW